MSEFNLISKPASDPLTVYRYRDGLYASDLLTAALVYLDFFTWIAKVGAVDLESICSHFKTAARPTDVMVSLFCAMGFLEKDGLLISATTVAREHLVEGSPWCLKPYYASLKDRPVTKDYLEVLRTDKPANWGSFKDPKDWTSGMLSEEFAKNFTAAMDCRGVYLAQALGEKLNLKGRRKLLDIAGGSGIYSCSLTTRFPELKAAVFERPPVDQIAFRAIAERKCSNRVEVIAGDMFRDALPTGFDTHLFSNVLHDWDIPLAGALLKKSFQALAPGGMLAIHDVHLNDDKTGPLPHASYSALLMHATEGRCYGRAEMFGLLRDVGFTDLLHEETAADRSYISALKPS
ncbi:MAG: methyltransferase [Verrucomicrobiales bacterium]